MRRHTKAGKGRINRQNTEMKSAKDPGKKPTRTRSDELRGPDGIRQQFQFRRFKITRAEMAKDAVIALR